MPYTVWHACPAGAGAWLPWRPVSGHLQHPLIAPNSASDAHGIARAMRSAMPGHLFAVRRSPDGEPLWPNGMADHYSLPPYV